MDYQNAFKILDAQSLNGFINKTESLALTVGGGVFTGDPAGYMDPVWYWNLRMNAMKYCGGGIEGLGCKITLLWWAIRDAIEAWWHNFSQMIFKRTRYWWDHFLETFKGLAWDISQEFKKFVRDPGGYIYQKVQYVVGPLIEGLKSTFFDVSYFVHLLWDRVRHTIEPLISDIKLGIQVTVIDAFKDVKDGLSFMKEFIVNLPNLIAESVISGSRDIPTTLAPSKEEIEEMIDNSKDIIVKTFDFGLGGLINTFRDFLGGLWDKAWNWFKDLISKVANFLNEKFFKPIWESVKWTWNWLVEIFSSFAKEVKNFIYSLAPSAPERGEEIWVQGLKLLGMGVAGFGALTGISMAVSWLSKHHLGHLSAILYDMSSYKYISAALFGGLITAAYAQPLKYFYNAKFRPYLPKFADVHSALGRSIISLDEFKFHLKYAGIPDKYIKMYQRLAQRPISAFMIRYIADAEITDPQGIFSICMDNGYSVEHSAYMAYAMSWGANASYRRAAETAVRKCFKEGFIDKAKMDQAISQIRTVKEVSVSYTTIDGYTYSARIKAPLDQKTLMRITAEWEAFYDSMYDKVSALKTAYSKENISEEELRSGLRALGIVENRIEDIVSREKAKKRAKTEPERGKTLRDELKSVFRRCYKEGFITAEYLDRLLEESNKIVDEKELIKQRANWEAFYDDMYDLVKIYKENLENGIIDEATFRRDLIDLGLRPEKVELMIKYIQAKLTGRIKEE